jgi:archaeal flagellar protein FlaI
MLKLKFNIFKDSLSALQKLQPINKIQPKLKKITPKTISEELEDDFNIPKYMTLSKLDWDNNEIHAGIIKDPTAKGGLRYQVIEPVLSERDQKAFEIIKNC